MNVFDLIRSVVTGTVGAFAAPSPLFAMINQPLHTSRRRFRVVAAGVALLVAVTVFAGIPRAGASDRAAASSIWVPARGALLGAYVEPKGWTQAEVRTAIRRLERTMDRKLAIDSHYASWGSKFPGRAVGWDLSNGRVPMYSGMAYSTAEINSGSQDQYIRGRARAVHRLDRNVLIRWFPEMDAKAHRSLRGSPRAFRKAWRRIVRLFRDEGARNAEFVWCPDSYAFRTGRAQPFYPGDGYVNWICADGYNWSPRLPGDRPGGKWHPFRDLFPDFYRFGLAHHKRMMVGETGAQESTAGRKATWISRLARALRTRYPRIKAVVYFDAIGSSNGGGTYNWRLDTSQSALDAWVRLSHAPWLNRQRP